MIDLHSHILSGLDDGAKTLDESIQMCRIGYRDGIRTIVATPHTLNGVYLNDRETILTKVRELNEAIKKFAVRGSEFGVDAKTLRPNDPISPLPGDSIDDSNQIDQRDQIDRIDLRIFPGSDVHLSEKTLLHLDQGKVMTIGDAKKYLFLEFAFQGIPYGAEEVISQLMKRGIIPIITHPERNLEVWQRPQRYYEMIRMGCLGQVTAMSLTGKFGPKVRQVSEKLLVNRFIHFIASDAHSVDGRPPILSEALRAAERIVGNEEARKMVCEYPRAILEGKRPDVQEPLSP